MGTSNFGLSPDAVAVPVLSFITLIFNIAPFVWHVKNRNLPASCLIFWIALCNLFNFINALLWPTDDMGTWWNGVILCDIEVKLANASTVGITGSLLCVLRVLAAALDTSTGLMVQSSALRRRKLAVEIIFCFGFPIYMIGIHYVVQPNRYYIFAIAGCTPSFDYSWLGIVLIYIWPSILCLIGAYYAGLIIVRLYKYRKEFAAILSSSNSNFTKSRFRRLFAMCFVLIVVFLPVQFYVMYRNIAFGVTSYSWSATHGPSWWDIIMVPTGGAVVFDRWIRIALGFTVFCTFGTGNDAVKMYRIWLLALGFGKLFPKLYRTDWHSPTLDQSIGSRPESFRYRTKRFLGGKLSPTTSSPTFSSGDASFTEPATPSPNDPGKAFAPLGTIPEQRNSSGDTTVGQTREIVSEKALPELPPHGIHSWIRKIRLPRLPFFRARDYNDGTSSGQSMSNSGRLMNKPPSSHGSKPSATSLNGRSSAQLPYFPGGSLV